MASKIDMKQVATVFFGVSNCGGGFVIIGGKIVKIPPRGPAYQKIQAALNTVLEEAGRLGQRVEM